MAEDCKNIGDIELGIENWELGMPQPEFLNFDF